MLLISNKFRFFLLFGLILLILFGSGFAFVHQFRIVIDNENRNERIILALSQVHRVTDDIQDAEAGQRGYLLTGDDTYLKPYYEGVADADQAFKAIRDASDGDQKTDEILDLLEQEKDLKFAELAKTIQLKHKHKDLEAYAIVRTNSGQKYMDAFRNDVSKLLILWRGYRAELRSDSHIRIGYTMTAAFALALSIVGVLIWSIWTQRNAYEEIQSHIEHLDHQVMHDPLTDLANRRKLLNDIDSLDNDLSETVGMIYIDIDGFKSVNDTMGHDKGDVLLKQLAKAFKKIITPRDTLARIGGDEFVFLIPDYKDDVHLVELANKIIHGVESISKIHYNGMINASVGIATYKSRVESVHDLLKAADGAMYKSKRSGRGKFNFS